MKKQTKKRHKMLERQEKKKSIRRKKHLEILLRKFRPVYMYSIWRKTEIQTGEKWEYWDEHGYHGPWIYPNIISAQNSGWSEETLDMVNRSDTARAMAYLSSEFENLLYDYITGNYSEDDEYEQTVAMTRPLQNWPVTFTGRDELIMRKFDIPAFRSCPYELGQTVTYGGEVYKCLGTSEPVSFEEDESEKEFFYTKNERIILQQPESPDADWRKLRQYNERVSKILEETDLKIII